MTERRDTLRCLAIRQPWAWAIAIGAKDIENRDWSTDHRGLFVIQASGTKTLVNSIAKAFKPKPAPQVSFEFGALIGVAEIVDVVPLHETLEANSWAFGPHCFRIANARVFDKPIEAKGKLNLYYLDGPLDAQVRAQLPSAKPAVVGETERAWLDMMQASSEERSDAHLQSYVALGAWPDAVRLAGSRITKDPDDHFAFRTRGIARWQMDEAKDAVTDLDRAVQLSEGEDGVALYFRGQVHESLGHAKKAEADYAKARALDPSLFDDAAAADGEDE